MSEAKDLAVIEAEQTALARPAEDAKDFGGYSGVATVSLTPEQTKELAEVLPDEAHDILPTGEVYVSQVHYRRLLNKVFGPGGWAMVPRGAFTIQKGARTETITREYALVGPGGRFISESIGEAEYQPTNERMSYASACEAVKSNALTRCCKDLGIASECWDRRWCDKWIAKHAAKVWRKGMNKPQWRRKDAAPWWDENPDAGEQPQKKREPEKQKDGAPAAGGESMAGCGHCGSKEAKRDPKAPGYLWCPDCGLGTKLPPPPA